MHNRDSITLESSKGESGERLSKASDFGVVSNRRKEIWRGTGKGQEKRASI